tara:strand:- start:1541 stop:2197 length:657 start_codon:yes stop_codon:yes gene_type:complete
MEEEITPNMQRLMRLFVLSLPSLGVLALTYIGLGDAVFGLFGVVGRRLPAWTRTSLRRFYYGLEATTAAALHLGMATSCYTSNVCTDRPLHRRACLVATSTAVVAFVVALAAGRCMEPMLKVPPDYPGHGRGTTTRVFDAAAVFAAWICLGEGETLGVVLLMAATARRALAPVPLVARVYMSVLKLYALVHTGWTLDHTCVAASRRAPVAIATTILFL